MALTDQELEVIGAKIAEMLHLEKDSNGRYPTTWGSKTDVGLAASLIRVIDEKGLGDEEVPAEEPPLEEPPVESALEKIIGKPETALAKILKK